jgi:hypothetical protein
MTTHVKQTGKLNGTSSLMVLGILFVTALPLINLEAGMYETAGNNPVENENGQVILATESTEPIMPIEAWMLTVIDWNMHVIAAESNHIVEIENWMLTPEYWDNDRGSELAGEFAANPKELDGWMFKPEGWRNDVARVGNDAPERDLVMVQRYF